MQKKPKIRHLCLFLVGTGCLVGSAQQNLQENSALISAIDSIVQIGIDSGAYPGAQVYISHRGESIVSKSYGYHSYRKEVQVKQTHLYDLASLTKVMTGLPLLMHLVSEKKIGLDIPIHQVFPSTRKSSFRNRTLREILAHQAGLEPYFVFWKLAQNENGAYRKNTFSSSYHPDYPIFITSNLFLHRDYHQEMEKIIFKSEVKKNPSYQYSGLFFLLLPDLLEPYLMQSFEPYLYENLFIPLGCTHLTYHPLEKFVKSDITPTELDTFFRNQLVHGRVHDEAAAMLDGISCNAGLFGNAGDVGKFFEWILGYHLDSVPLKINSAVRREFTAYQYVENRNRRGLGFDKPLLHYEPADAYIAQDASPNSFGHSGFTGTFAWADPDHDLVVVFLSNRVYPDRSRRKLYSMGIRPKLHQTVYKYLAKIPKSDDIR